MASTAISAQGTIFQIATGAGSAKTISGTVGVGNPTVLTSTAHGFVNGDYITFSAGFTGANASALNSKSYAVQFKTTNTFAVSEDTTGLTITVGTATATSATYTAVANVRAISSAFDGSASEIDVTNLASTGKEFRLGLVDNGGARMDIHLDNADAGQVAVRSAQVASTQKAFKLILPSGTTPTASFNGFVKSFPVTGVGVDGVVGASIDIKITGAVTWA